MKKLIIQLMAITVLLLLFSVNVKAQDALWQLDFDKEIVFNQNTEAGILLVGTNDFKLHGVDSRDGNLLWTSEALNGAKKVRGADGKKIDAKYAFDNYLNVLEDPEYPEISDFLEIKFADVGQVFKNYAVINMQTGKEVISPRAAGMPIQKVPLYGELATFNYGATGYIPELRMIIISATWQDFMTKGQPFMYMTKMVELPSAKVIWTNNDIGIDGFPYVLENDEIVLPGKTQIARVNAKTGDVKWSYNTSEKKQTFESFDLSLDLSTGYFFEKKKNSGALSAVDMVSGAKKWEQELKLKVVPTMSAMGYGVVVIDDKNFTLYDLNGGNVKWTAKKIDG